MRADPTLRAHVVDLRRWVADQIEALDPEQWDAPSWLPRWRVRDVLGHLVWGAESTPWSMFRDFGLDNVRPNRGVDRLARHYGRQPVMALADRLRAAADQAPHRPGRAAVALGDVIVHACDALRPLGLDVETEPEVVVPVLDAYRVFGPFIFHTAPSRKVTMIASDTTWSAGRGPVVTGRALDLVLLLANRRQVVGTLAGPGLARFRN